MIGRRSDRIDYAGAVSRCIEVTADRWRRLQAWPHGARLAPRVAERVVPSRTDKCGAVDVVVSLSAASS
jgi:hypothetical protein